MSDADIVSRLRLLPEPQCRPCLAAADEIERLRSLVRFQDTVIRSGDVACLTAAERRAIKLAMQGGTPASDDVESQMVETLRGLLDRLGSGESHE